MAQGPPLGGQINRGLPAARPAGFGQVRSSIHPYPFPPPIHPPTHPPTYPTTSDVYKKSYNEVRALGRKDSTVRTAEQTAIATFWKKSPELGWFSVLDQVVNSTTNPVQAARSYAVASLAFADSRIGAIDNKVGRWVGRGAGSGVLSSHSTHPPTLLFLVQPFNPPTHPPTLLFPSTTTPCGAP